MKGTRRIGRNLDDAVFNVALFFLVMVATLAALDLASLWLIAACLALYVTVGMIVCLLPNEQKSGREDRSEKELSRRDRLSVARRKKESFEDEEEEHEHVEPVNRLRLHFH